jgi:sugar lactone lactonase YvrE
MAMRSTTATVLYSPTAEADRFLPEGPRAVTVDGKPAIAWVNIQTAPDATAGTIQVRFWDGEHRAYPQERRPGFFLPTDRENVLLVGREKEIGLLNLASNSFTPLATIDDGNPRTIINDGEIVPGGRAVVFGTKDVQFAEPIANLYLFTLDDRRVSVLADRQVCSNGKVFAREGDRLFLYDIDTPQKNVVRYGLDLAARRVSPPEEVFDLREHSGFPDGMTDVGDGSAIIAFYNPAPVYAGRAIRFDLRTSEMLEDWVVPGSPRVTCPLLVEHDGRVRLVLTTATEGMPAAERRSCPNAGDLFWAETTLERVPSVELVRLGTDS